MSRIDPDRGVAVWIFGGLETDADWQAYVDALREGQKLAASATVQPVFAVQIVDPGSPIPPAIWRQRIAEASSQVPGNVLFVLVSASTAVRAVSTALAWLRPPTYEQTAVATLDEAIALVTERRKTAVPAIVRLHREARAALEKRPP